MFIDDTPGIGVLEMRAKSRRLMAEHGLDMLIVDYIQLMQGRGRFENRTLELAAISRSLKMLAKELNVPVVILSQLSRAPEARSDHRPHALGPARVRRPRTGRRRRHAALPPRPVSRRASPKTRTSPRSTSPSSATAPPATSGSRSCSEKRDSAISSRADDPGTGTCHEPGRLHRSQARVAGPRFAGRVHRFTVRMIRWTVADVDLDAIAHNFRAVRDSSLRRFTGSRCTGARVQRSRGSLRTREPRTCEPEVGPRHHRGRQGQRVRPRLGPVALALERAGATMLACADIEEAIVLRKAGVRRDSDFRGAERQRRRRHLRTQPHADDLHAVGRRRRCKRRPRGTATASAVI